MSTAVKPPVAENTLPFGAPEIAGIATALDERRMKHVLARHLPNEEIPELATCTILAKRYKPHRHCSIAYALRWPERRRPLIVTAQLVSRSTGATVLAASAKPPDAIVSELSMRLWTFPSDPGLSTLEPVLSDDNLDRVLGARGQDVDILKYVPGRRCVFKAGRVLAKVCDHPGGLSVFFSMYQVWRTLRDIESRLHVPRPLGYDPTLRLFWRGFVDGETFETVARHRAGLLGASMLAGQVLAALHTTPVRGPLAPTTPDALRTKLRQRCRLLGKWRPELTPRVARLRTRLERALPKPGLTPVTFIHGDFNHSQLIFDDRGATLIDFDTAGLGDPLYDVALYLSGLHGLAEDGRFDRKALGEAALGFLRSYEDRVAFAVYKRRLSAYLSWALVCRRAHRAVRRLEHDAPGKVEHYLELAERYLD